MSAEQNMRVVQQAIEAVNTRDLDRVPDFVTPNFQRHDLAEDFGGDFVGREGASNFLEFALGVIPDVRLNVERIIGTSEYVTVHIVAVGTHEGEFLGVEPTGNRVEFNQISIYRFEGGKIAETWQLVDLASLLQQIGVLQL